MSSETDVILQLFGRFHPLLVHLPIGGVLVLGCLELLALSSRFQALAQGRRVVMAILAGAALITTLCGWLLSRSGAYDAQLLQWHKWTGSAVAAGCALTFWLSLRSGARPYRVCLGATIAILVVAGHLGGSITHGRGFLTWRSGAARSQGPALTVVADEAPSAPTGPAARDPFFSEFVQPILREHCSSCHGPEKQEAGLRLDNLESLCAGGASGRAFVPGHARKSLLIERLLLPESDDDHMPPDGRPPLSQTELALLKWWINNESGEPAPVVASSGSEQLAPGIPAPGTAGSSSLDPRPLPSSGQVPSPRSEASRF